MNMTRIALSLSLLASSLPAVAQDGRKELKLRPKASSAASTEVATLTPAAADPAKPAVPAAAPSAAPTQLTPPAPAPSAGSEERQQLDKLTAANMMEQQKLSARLRPLSEEREELAVKNAISTERHRAELQPIEHEHRKLQLKGQIQDEKQVQEVVSLRYERDRLRLANDITREKLNAEQLKADAEKLKMDVAMRELDFQSRKLRFEAELADNKTVALKAELELRDKKDAYKRRAERDPEYLKEPFKDGVLTVSDRRISLDGPIVYGTADDITERIDYFNNKSEKDPIFLVIDRSPGGSVMEGYRILKAMQASKAPVHVVVKSYAASMAATIATLAPKSYAYPNAVILHHQIWSTTSGNPTQQRQQLDTLKEWDKRLREPVAKKMGMSFDQFTKELYEHNVDGDWDEFADRAAKLKWIDQVVHEIRETGIVKEPERKKEDKPRLAYGMAEVADDKGERYVRLPRLQPFDAYFLHNRDGYYR